MTLSYTWNYTTLLLFSLIEIQIDIRTKSNIYLNTLCKSKPPYTYFNESKVKKSVCLFNNVYFFTLLSLKYV